VTLLVPATLRDRQASGHPLAAAGPVQARRAARAEFPDWRFAPNIGGHPRSYALENQAVDKAGHVLAAMRRVTPWAGRTIVDLGCGTGYWLRSYAAEAARVIGVEPDPRLRTAAHRAAESLARTEILAGSAECIPLADQTVDVVHARFAYFFPPGADSGLTEVLRVLRPGGQFVAVDNDYRWGEFARLLAASAPRPPHETAAVVDAWWRERGAVRYVVRSELTFASRADLAEVLRIEFPAAIADGWLRQHPTATGLSYGFTLFAVARPGRRVPVPPVLAQA
jgi:ubiquinone/menaquinone biosynthesis C-methylase UbiE